jgi:hypothetical protein
MRHCIFEFYADPCGAERGGTRGRGWGEAGSGVGGGESGSGVWGNRGRAMMSVELKLERFAFPCRDTFE